jgi:hypothetical protein
MIAAESRERSVATKSVVSSMGTALATTILTGMGGGACPCPPPRRQPPTRATAASAAPATAESRRARFFMIGPMNLFRNKWVT